MDTELFDSDFLRKLEFLTLFSRRLHRGDVRGEHSTYRKGTSLEFHDYRTYQAGDDFRYIDWNVFSRIDKLFVKLFRAEEDLTLHLLVDTSASMSFGNPSKIEYAKKIGAALGFIGISNLDRVGATSFSSRLQSSLPAYRSRRQLFSLLEYFSLLVTEGGTSFNNALIEYSLKARRPGLAIVISDLLDPDGFTKGVRALLYRKFEVVLIHVVAEEELQPPQRGAFRFTDSETGEERKITVDSSLLRTYQGVMTAFFTEVETFSLKSGVEYLRVSTIIPFEDLILKYLRQGMHLK